MPELVVRFVAVICLLVCLGGQSLASFWLPPPTLPSNPNDPYYQAFQNVPPASVTATKLMNNFLNIYPANPLSRLKRQLNIRDVVFVLDGSGSIGSCEFDKGRKALKYMMGIAAKSSSLDMKYAAVTFASYAGVNFKFLPYSTAANEILNIRYPGGSTNTQDGLGVAKGLFDDSSSGRRSNAKQMIFLVTDGQSNDKQLTISKAQELKNVGLEIFVVGVGTYISGIDEMVRVASNPPEKHLYRVNNLTGFLEIIKLIMKNVSPIEYAIANGQYEPPC